MYGTSPAWDKVFEQNMLPETNVIIQLDMTDPTIGDVATVVGYEEAEFSNSANMMNAPVFHTKSASRDVFLEYNMWVLDGKGVITEDNFMATGYTCAEGLEGEEHLTIALSQVATTPIPGFTIYWSVEQNEWASEFFVYVYNGSTRVASLYVENDSPISVIDLPVSNYDRVVIYVESWSMPGNRIRIEQVSFGHILSFDKNQILSYTHEQSGDPVSQELSSYSITFSLDNSDGKWDILNPQGLYKHLYEQQRVVVYYGVLCPPDASVPYSQYNWVRAGFFYLTEWRAPSNGLEAVFVAKDEFSLLQSKTYTYRPARKAINATINENYSGNPVPVYATFEDAVAEKSAIGSLTMGTMVTVYEVRNYGREDQSTLRGRYARTEYGWMLASDVWLSSDYLQASDMLENVLTVLPTVAQCGCTVDYLESYSAPFVLENVNAANVVQWLCNANGLAHKRYGQSLEFRRLGSYSGTPSYIVALDKAYSYPEVELPYPVKEIVVKKYNIYDPEEVTDCVHSVGDSGETVTVDNPYRVRDIPSDEMPFYMGQKRMKGEFLANPILELFDVVGVEDKYGVVHNVRLTRIKYTYTGSFCCEYTGLILD